MLYRAECVIVLICVFTTPTAERYPGQRYSGLEEACVEARPERPSDLVSKGGWGEAPLHVSPHGLIEWLIPKQGWLAELSSLLFRFSDGFLISSHCFLKKQTSETIMTEQAQVKVEHNIALNDTAWLDKSYRVSPTECFINSLIIPSCLEDFSLMN